MPVDASIPLQVKPFEGMNPQQVLSLQHLSQQMQMQNEQLTEFRRKREVENQLRNIYSRPDAIDPTTKMPTERTLADIAKVDPATFVSTRGKMIEATEKQAITEKNVAQMRAALAGVDEKDRKIMNQIQVGAHDAYEAKLKETQDPAQATRTAQEFFSSRLTEEDKLGVLGKKYIEAGRSQPFDAGRSEIMIKAMRPLGVEKEVGPSDLKRLMDERDALPEGSTRRKEYDDKIKKLGAPTAAMAGATSNFEGRNGEILAAMAERGASLPTGFRSKEQQAGLLNGLSKRYPDLSPDQIADKIVKGQLDLTGLKKEVQVAGTQAGKIAYAENEIEQTIPLVREASAKLPRGKFVPYEKLKQMGEAAFSDPDLAEFKMYMTSLSNAYDMLAARGGTDMEKRKENRRNFETAQSPEALERVLQAVRKEAQASGRAAKASMDVTKKPGSEAEPPSRRSTDNNNDPLGIRGNH